jgi:hypothetical protein
MMGTKAGIAAGAIATLIIGSGTAYAATGGNFILGKANAAGTTTSLKNPNGTALTLTSRPGTPALRVSNGVKVPQLNADKLDGRDSSQFALTSGRTAYKRALGAWEDLDGDGVGDAIVAFAQCPLGSRLTGGGFTDFTETGVVVDNSPTGARIWVVAALADPTVDSGSDLEAYAVCYNPRGSVGGGTTAARTLGGVSPRSDYLRRLADLKR